MMYFSCCLIMILFLFSACDPDSYRNAPVTFEEETCNAQKSSVALNNLQEIDSINVSRYQISGSCDRNNSEVKIFIEGYPLDRKPICQKNKWAVESVDISGIVNQKRRVQIAVSQASGRGNLLCKNIENFFVCPDGYIGVSSMEDYSYRSFCVMKYEAKTRDKEKLSKIYNVEVIKAEPLSGGTVITRRTQSQAIKDCQENGGGYDLLSNDEWQAIARSIEQVPSNWFAGDIHISNDNAINIGNTGSIKHESDLEDNKINDDRWSKNKRTHKLLNGEYIWDFSGNVSEIVRHDINNLPVAYSGEVYKMPSQLKSLFGPENDYSSIKNRVGNKAGVVGVGLGFVQANRFSGMILRGLARGSSRIGIFSVNTEMSASRPDPRSGFRCAYHP